MIVGRIRENDSAETERLVAMHDDVIVADGSFERERYGWGDKIGQIRLLVAPGFRRSALGTSLARMLYVIAHQHDVDRINVRMLRPQVAAATSSAGWASARNSCCRITCGTWTASCRT